MKMTEILLERNSSYDCSERGRLKQLYLLGSPLAHSEPLPPSRFNLCHLIWPTPHLRNPTLSSQTFLVKVETPIK